MFFSAAMASGRFEFVKHNILPFKHAATLDTHFLLRSFKKSVWEILDRARGKQRDPQDLSLNSGKPLRDEVFSGKMFQFCSKIP